MVMKRRVCFQGRVGAWCTGALAGRRRRCAGGAEEGRHAGLCHRVGAGHDSIRMCRPVRSSSRSFTMSSRGLVALDNQNATQADVGGKGDRISRFEDLYVRAAAWRVSSTTVRNLLLPTSRPRWSVTSGSVPTPGTCPTSSVTRRRSLHFRDAPRHGERRVAGRAEVADLPVHDPAGVAKEQTGARDRQIIGTGPFSLGEWVKDSHLVIKRFDGYLPDTSSAGRDGYAGRARPSILIPPAIASCPKRRRGSPRCRPARCSSPRPFRPSCASASKSARISRFAKCFPGRRNLHHRQFPVRPHRERADPAGDRRGDRHRRDHRRRGRRQQAQSLDVVSPGTPYDLGKSAPTPWYDIRTRPGRRSC